MKIPPLRLTVIALSLCAATWVQAEGRHDAHWVLDGRYHHDHYYPARGYVVGAVPRGALSIGFGGDNFFFQAGVWYRPFGGRFTVVLPPIGIGVPILPPGCTVIWIANQPYYYANGVYYAQNGAAGYTVVPAPAGIESQPMPASGAPVLAPPNMQPPVPVAPAAPPEPVIYPRNGQNAMTTEADRQECNRWASTQAKASDPSVFVRGVAACMDARGYTVR